MERAQDIFFVEIVCEADWKDSSDDSSAGMKQKGGDDPRNHRNLNTHL